MSKVGDCFERDEPLSRLMEDADHLMSEQRRTRKQVNVFAA